MMQDHGSDTTLAMLWRTTALRVPQRAVVGLLLAGIAIVAGSLFTAARPVLVAIGLLVFAFAAYAATIQSSAHPRITRFLATATSTIAALAALTIGLLLLAAIFGGSIEVMRR